MDNEFLPSSSFLDVVDAELLAGGKDSFLSPLAGKTGTEAQLIIECASLMVLFS